MQLILFSQFLYIRVIQMWGEKGLNFHENVSSKHFNGLIIGLHFCNAKHN